MNTLDGAEAEEEEASRALNPSVLPTDKPESYRNSNLSCLLQSMETLISN